MAHGAHVVIPSYCPPRSPLCSPSHNSPRGFKTTMVTINRECKPCSRPVDTCQLTLSHSAPCWSIGSMPCSPWGLSPPASLGGQPQPPPPQDPQYLSSSCLGFCFVSFSGFLSWVGEVVLQNSLLFCLRLLVLAWLEGHLGRQTAAKLMTCALWAANPVVQAANSSLA